MCRGALVAALGAIALGSVAHADDATWASRAQVGYTKTGGNTDTSSANALFHIAHVVDRWKFLFGVEGLYGSTRGETTAQAWDVHFQANYRFTDRLFWYGALRYDDNRFSGFAYQQTTSTGVGYQLIASDATKLSTQLGVGVRRLRPEILTEDSVGAITGVTELAPTTDAVLDFAVNFEHALSQYTKLIANVAVESGRNNTMTSAGVSLQVKMSEVLSLAAGYQLVRNSQPPPGAGPNTALTTLNLVYARRNPKLAPD